MDNEKIINGFFLGVLFCLVIWGSFVSVTALYREWEYTLTTRIESRISYRNFLTELQVKRPGINWEVVEAV